MRKIYYLYFIAQEAILYKIRFFIRKGFYAVSGINPVIKRHCKLSVGYYIVSIVRISQIFAAVYLTVTGTTVLHIPAHLTLFTIL